MTSRSRAALAVAAALALALGACGQFASQADAKFGDQHFKTAISLVELYRLRHGSYPSSLNELDFLGGWDRIALSAVRYERLSEGYELDLVRGWIGKPEVSFPPEFWKGLGIRRSNVGGMPPGT